MCCSYKQARWTKHPLAINKSGDIIFDAQARPFFGGWADDEPVRDADGEQANMDVDKNPLDQNGNAIEQPTDQHDALQKFYSSVKTKTLTTTATTTTTTMIARMETAVVQQPVRATRSATAAKAAALVPQAIDKSSTDEATRRSNNQSHFVDLIEANLDKPNSLRQLWGRYQQHLMMTTAATEDLLRWIGNPGNIEKAKRFVVTLNTGLEYKNTTEEQVKSFIKGYLLLPIGFRFQYWMHEFPVVKEVVEEINKTTISGKTFHLYHAQRIYLIACEAAKMWGQEIRHLNQEPIKDQISFDKIYSHKFAPCIIFGYDSNKKYDLGSMGAKVLPFQLPEVVLLLDKRLSELRQQCGHTVLLGTDHVKLVLEQYLAITPKTETFSIGTYYTLTDSGVKEWEKKMTMMEEVK